MKSFITGAKSVVSASGAGIDGAAMLRISAGEIVCKKRHITCILVAENAANRPASRTCRPPRRADSRRRWRRLRRQVTLNIMLGGGSAYLRSPDGQPAKQQVRCPPLASPALITNYHRRRRRRRCCCCC